jgi:hypothetical protein
VTSDHDPRKSIKPVPRPGIVVEQARRDRIRWTGSYVGSVPRSLLCNLDRMLPHDGVVIALAAATVVPAESRKCILQGVALLSSGVAKSPKGDQNDNDVESSNEKPTVIRHLANAVGCCTRRHPHHVDRQTRPLHAVMTNIACHLED